MSSYYRLIKTLSGHHGMLPAGAAYLGQPCLLSPFVMLNTSRGPEMVGLKDVILLPSYSSRVGDDVLEQAVAQALDKAGVEYLTDYEGTSPKSLDFYLPSHDVHIEIKAAHTPRVSGQMARVDNVIVLQGAKAVALFALALDKRPQPT